MLGILDFTDETRDDIDPRFLGELLGLDLVPHRRNRADRRPDKGNALGLELLGKAGPLGQEAIARVNRLGPGLLAGGDDLVGDQIGLCSGRRADVHGLVRHLHERRAGIGIGIDRNGLDTHPAGGLDHPASDFATVGDEDFLEHQSFPTILRNSAVRRRVISAMQLIKFRPCWVVGVGAATASHSRSRCLIQLRCSNLNDRAALAPSLALTWGNVIAHWAFSRTSSRSKLRSARHKVRGRISPST